MSFVTEWFEGRSVDEHYQRCNWSRVAMELACAVCVGLILGGLSGCATEKKAEPTDNVCLMKLVGRTGEGEPVVRMICVTQDQFAESQK